MNPQSTAEHPQSTVIESKNMKINSNTAVFEIANNFIVRIQLLANRLVNKEFTTMQVPRNTFNNPHSPSQFAKKKSSASDFEIANNFITGIPFLTQRIVTKKLGTPKAPRNPPKLPLFAPKIRTKTLILPFLRSPIILLLEHNF